LTLSKPAAVAPLRYKALLEVKHIVTMILQLKLNVKKTLKFIYTH